MLNLVWLPTQACQKTLWTAFDPGGQTWIINDRKTKFFLNQSLLEKKAIISEPVKRAKEFWKDLLRLADPEMKVLDDLGTRIQASDFLLSEGKSEWCSRPNAPQKLINASQTLASLLTHPLIEEYTADFEGAFLELVQLGSLFYQRCLEKKRLPQFFLPSFLAQTDGPLLSDTQLFFDLGFDMREGDRDLIQHLSKTNDVTVLIPAANSKTLEETGLYAYRNFDLGLVGVKNIHETAKDQGPSAAPVLWRCSSPEAEARKAVEKVKQWIENGISPHRICIASENLGNYENILNHDLEWEGIGFHRRIQTVLSASRLFRALNARLLIVKGALSAALLEEAFLSVAIYKKSIRRREERRVLNPIIHEDQIPNPELKSQVIELKARRKKRMSVVEFEGLVIHLFKKLVEEAAAYENPLEAEQRNELFLKALAKLRGEVGDVDLDLNQWIEAWQEVANTIRLPLKQPSENGVWGIELSSLEENPADHIILLGSVESSARQSLVTGEKTLLSLKEKGFDLSSRPRRPAELLTQWILTGERKEFVLSCPKTDSAGKAVSASPLWLKLAARNKKNLDHLDFAVDTNWIGVQKAIASGAVAEQVDRFKRWEPGTALKLAGLVEEDLSGKRKIQLNPGEGGPLGLSLSASKIEAYWKCPYIFFAGSHLKLYDEEDLEIEPSAQKQGQWLHSAVEKILNDPRPLDEWNAEALSSLIDTLDEVQKQVSSDIWPSIRTRFVRRILRFVQFEIEWRKKYPRAKPMGLEVPISGFLTWEAETPGVRFAKTQPSSGFWASFAGKIDRLDVTTSGKAIVLDYKSGASAAKNIPYWLENGFFQLALYSQAVEAGLLKDRSHDVIAAHYYTLRKLERDRGFKLIDEDLVGILPGEGPRDAAITAESRKIHFDEIGVLVHTVLENIRSGVMTPLEESESFCLTCSWRTSCRAPHLS